MEPLHDSSLALKWCIQSNKAKKRRRSAWATPPEGIQLQYSVAQMAYRNHTSKKLDLSQMSTTTRPTWRLWPSLQNCPEIRNCSFLVPIGHAGVPQGSPKGLKHGEGPGACGQAAKLPSDKELLVLCPYSTRRGTPRLPKRLETWEWFQNCAVLPDNQIRPFPALGHSTNDPR